MSEWIVEVPLQLSIQASSQDLQSTYTVGTIFSSTSEASVLSSMPPRETRTGRYNEGHFVATDYVSDSASDSISDVSYILTPDITKSTGKPFDRHVIESTENVLSAYASVDQEAGKLCLSQVVASSGLPVSQPEKDATCPFVRADRNYAFLRLTFGPLSEFQASQIVCGDRILPLMVIESRDKRFGEDIPVTREARRHNDSVVHLIINTLRPLSNKSAWFNYHTMITRLLKIAESSGLVRVVENVFQHTSLNADLLSAAAAMCLSDSVERLTRRAGIHVNSRDSLGYTPLTWACISGDSNLVDRMSRELHASVNEFSSDFETPLLTACRYHQPQVARVLLQINDTDVNECDQNGNTALHLAISVSARGGRTRLHNACIDGNFNWSRQVLFAEAATDINAQDNDGWSALHFACLTGHRDIARLLVWAGADATLTDEDCSTPIDLALNAGFKKMPDIVSLRSILEDWLPVDFPFYMQLIESNDHG